MPLLLRNCSYLVKDSGAFDKNVDLLVEGNRIAEIGASLPVSEGVEILNCSGCAVIPGLVNSHTHLYQNLVKGVAPGIPLVPWCDQVLFPALGAFREHINQTDYRLPYLWSSLSAIEMIRGGITSCVDMDAVYPEIIHAWQEVGFRGVLAYTLANKWVPPELRAREAIMKEQVIAMIDEHHRPAGLTTVFLAPSTLFLCTDDFLLWAGETTRRHDLGMQIHIAETASEVADQVKETGRSPLAQLHFLGLLNDRLSAVHCVHLDDADIALLAEHNVSVVHCPKSNMKLADGVAPIGKMLACGIPIGVATDGSASNDLLDMWEEMRAALLLARVTSNNANALAPATAFRMATIDGARVARLDCGALHPGKLADIAIIDLDAAHLQPFHDEDLMNMMVFCVKAGDVRDTIINGTVVMRDRRLTKVDETAIIREIKQLDPDLSARRRDLKTHATLKERNL